MINYLVQSGFPHLRATSVCPNVLQYTRVYLNHFTNRRRRSYHLRKRFELQDALRRARYFYEAQKALLLFAKTIARWIRMRDKPVIR